MATGSIRPEPPQQQKISHPINKKLAMKSILEAYGGLTADLDTWYIKRRPLFVDVVGDFGGKELFVIDGDSLLRHVLSTAHLDFGAGFQILHGVYLVERFLMDLRRRRCNFHLAFFEENRLLCIPPRTETKHAYKYTLLRICLIHHLRHASKVASQLVHMFPCMQSTKFQIYLRSVRPYFFMAHDGAVSASRSESSTTVTAQIFLLRSNIVQVLKLGLHVALLNEVVFRDSKVFTMVLECGSAMRTMPSSCESMLSARVSVANHLEANIQAQSKFVEEGEDQNYLCEDIPSIRQQLVVWALQSTIFDHTKARLQHMIALALQTALLDLLSLSERAYLATQGLRFEKDQELELEQFISAFGIFSDRILRQDEVSAFIFGRENAYIDLHDLFDANIFRYVLHLFAELGPSWTSKQLLLKYNAVAKHVPGLAHTKIESVCFERYASIPSALTAVVPRDQSSSISLPLPKATYELQTFSHPVFNKYLSELDLNEEPASASRKTEDGAARTQLVPSNGFKDVTHWHVLKPLHDREVARSNARKLRSEQLYMKGMHRYAASLTGALGNILEPKLIITNKPVKKPGRCSNGKDRVKDNTKLLHKEHKFDFSVDIPKNDQEQFGKTKDLQKLSRKDQIIAANKERMAEKSLKIVRDAFNIFLKEIKAETNAEIIEAFLKTEDYFRKLDSEAKQNLINEVAIFKINLLFKLWCRVCEGRSQSQRTMEDYCIVARIFNEVYSLSKSGCYHPQVKKFVGDVFEALGFTGVNPLQKKTSKANNLKTSERLQVPNIPTSIATSSKITYGFEEFQLKYCGIFLDRDMGSAKDERTPFEPDAWQREVLDEIDKGSGLLVVAPTSAGKTFISFYAMEKILKESDDAVLVYVAPTKALVNQIAAEVQSRFRKKYPHAGRTVWAIHTRDYRINNPTNCQILITVPHILQIMLLSASNASSWSPRLKQIIFDEVHCIGQAEDGVIWEQLLILAPCPVIALSATVENPNEFGDWINTAQKSVGVSFKTITFPHRYSDLRKYVFTSSSSATSSSSEDVRKWKNRVNSSPFTQLDDDESMIHIHPIIAIETPSAQVLRDMALEPRESLSLFKALEQTYKGIRRDLHPEVFFSGRLIKKAEVLKWTAELQGLLIALIPTSDFKIIRQCLAEKAWIIGSSGLSVTNERTDLYKDENEADIQRTGTALWEEVKFLDMEFSSSDSSSESGLPSDAEDRDVTSENSRRSSLIEDADVSNSQAVKTTLPLLRVLQNRNALPALLFSYDRGLCENLCTILVEELEASEDEFRKTNPHWQLKLEAWEKWKAQKKKAKKATEKRKSKANSKKDDSDAHGEILDVMNIRVPSIWDTFDPEDPEEAFSFGNRTNYSREEYIEDTEMLKKGGIAEIFLRALKRGIGVHHAGLSRKLRECVERLFRKGYLRVVIATGTLALGINMPCVTTCFVGDHLFLTPLNYQQASGRAGRRGFDLIGNVVFHGIPMEKVARLMSAKLPTLHGHFPITTTLVLRLFMLLQGSGNSIFAKRAVEGLLRQSRLYLGEDDFKGEVLHHLRFSIEFLRRHNLLDAQGNPLELSGMTSHLYYTENSSFAFHALLRQGVFHEICRDVQNAPKAVCDRLMLVLAHLFCHRPLQKARNNSKEWQETVKRSSSIVILPPLEAWIGQILSDQNSLTLRIFEGYVKSFAQQHRKAKPDNVLPFTQKICKPLAGNLRLSTVLKKGSVAPNDEKDEVIPSVSTFYALSGHAESYTSIADLCAAVRSDIAIESSAIPHLPVKELSTTYNAYLYDFYRHGAIEPLVNANGIRRSDVWFALNDFSLVLATIVTSLKVLVGFGSFEEVELLEENGEMGGLGELAEDSDELDENVQDGKEEGRNERSAAAEENSTKAKEWINVLMAFTRLKQVFDGKMRDIGATRQIARKKRPRDVRI